jgi:hypothetical protein
MIIWLLAYAIVGLFAWLMLTEATGSPPTDGLELAEDVCAGLLIGVPALLFFLAMVFRFWIWPKMWKSHHPSHHGAGAQNGPASASDARP